MILISLQKKKEMKKLRPIQNTWYNWLINYIPEPIRKRASGFKDKIANVFKTNTPKQTVYGRGKKLSKPKKLTEPKKTKQKKSLFIRREQKKLKID